jgi:hypothetical protein
MVLIQQFIIQIDKYKNAEQGYLVYWKSEV